MAIPHFVYLRWLLRWCDNDIYCPRPKWSPVRLHIAPTTIWLLSLHSPVSVSVVTITLWVLGRWSPISWVKVLFGDCLVSRALKVQLPLLLLRRLTEWVIKQQQGSTYCEKSQRNSRRDGKWKKHVAHFVGKKIVAGSLLRSSALFCWVEYFIHENHLCEMQLGHIIITPFILFLGVIFCPSPEESQTIKRITPEGCISMWEFILRAPKIIYVNCED